MNFDNLNLSKYKLLSVDIFDTLLMRFFSDPKDLFLELGNVLVKQKQPVKYSPQEFKILRIDAEKDARILNKKTSGEVTLSDIYNQFPKNFENRTFALEQELILEKKFCFLNEFMCNLINEANRRGIPTILVSDMYFSEEQITDILASKDFNLSSVDRIYMSSDYKCNKAIGTIWDIVFDDYSYCQHSDLLHIGDNYKSDYQIPKSYNINCIYYDTISTNLSTFFNYESTFIKQPNSISSIRKLAVKSGLEKNNVTDEIGGSILGPLLTFFIDWVINISIKNG